MDLDDQAFVNLLKKEIPYDPQYEQEKSLMKDINVINYLIAILEIRKPFYEAAVQFACQKFSCEIVKPKVKAFLTLLIFSYHKQAPKSADLSYIKRFIYQKRPQQSIQFYTRLRKTILQNFTKDSRAQMLDSLTLKFGINLCNSDDWSTLVTRFLGAEYIAIIGAKVKEENNKTRIHEKILANSVDAVYFVQNCVDLFEANLAEQVPVNKKLETKSLNQSQELIISDNPKSQTETDQEQIQEPYPQQMHQNMPPIKLLNQLQETKYQLLDEKMKQQIIISKTVKAYENLADEYYYLMKHSLEQNLLLTSLANKSKKGQLPSTDEMKKIQDLQNFKYLKSDPKNNLLEIGAYDYTK